jgi:peptidoglycan L-alanyl-D-glutamate endopeptidase CwlK
MLPDPISLKRLARLHPDIREKATDIAFDIWAAGIGFRVTYTLRTFEEQNALYAIGRTSPGKIVTNAKGGRSYHNYGLALDFCLLKPNGKASWDIKADFNKDIEADWMQIVNAYKRNGWEWGGDWVKFKDYPHLQYTFGHPVGNLMVRSSNGIIPYPSLA